MRKLSQRCHTVCDALAQLRLSKMKDASVRGASKAFAGACKFELVILYHLLLLINDAFAISEVAMLLGPSPFVCAIRVSEALLILLFPTSLYATSLYA